jgi:surface protein
MHARRFQLAATDAHVAINRAAQSRWIRAPGGLSIPDAPTLDSVTPGDTTNTVAWTPPAGSPDSYNLYWSLTSPVSKASNKIAGATSPYVHTGRTNGTPYYYAVTAVKGGLESALSNELSGTPFLASFQITTTTSPQNFTLQLDSPSNLVINWGDGTTDTYTTAGLKTHAYATAGTYVMTVLRGTCTRMAFGDTSCTPTLLKAILTPISASLGLTSAYRMFKDCTGLGNTGWCAGFFDAASANITNMTSLFANCTAFNQSVANLNTAKVTSMLSMFYGCTAFNQSVANFNTAKVTDMQYMFYGCTAFNQDISGFILTALTAATQMLQDSGFTQTNYDKLLDIATGWPSQAVKDSVAFHAGTAKYAATGNPKDGRDHLTGVHSWTITDGGAA